MENRNNAETEMELGLDMMPDGHMASKTAEDYWKRFVLTGKIADYLNYTASESEKQISPDIE